MTKPCKVPGCTTGPGRRIADVNDMIARGRAHWQRRIEGVA